MELTRAQLEALLGQRERAVALLRDAFARGLSMSTALHTNGFRIASRVRAVR